MRNLILAGLLVSPIFAFAKDANVCATLANVVSARKDAHAQALAAWEAIDMFCNGDKRCEYHYAQNLANSEADLNSALAAYQKAGCNE